MNTNPDDPPARKPLTKRATPSQPRSHPPDPADAPVERMRAAESARPGSGARNDPVAHQLLYTTAQAAARLQVPASWLRKKSAAGLIPRTRLGRHIRFSEEDLASIIRDGARPPRQ